MILDFSQVMPINGVITFPEMVLPSQPLQPDDVRESVIIGGSSAGGSISATGSVDTPSNSPSRSILIVGSIPFVTRGKGEGSSFTDEVAFFPYCSEGKMDKENTSGDCFHSVLDDVPVINQAFKSFGDFVGPTTMHTNVPDPYKDLEVVSKCPTCGCPIYGPKTVTPGNAALVQRTCYCHALPEHQKDIRDTWHGK